MRLLLAVLLFGLLSACGPQYIGPPIGDRTHRPVKIPGHHAVRTGDTLYSIAFMYGVSVEELADWNGILKPYTIYTGQQLRLTPPPRPQVTPALPSRPVPPPSQPKVQRELLIPAPSRPKTGVAVVAPSRPKTTAIPPASQPKISGGPAPAPVARAAAPEAAPAVAEVSPPQQFVGQLVWDWPADGRLVNRYDPDSPGKKGIDIAGNAGAPVRAAAPGKVVYAGSGLSGYGRLIIIKHNDEFLSAYAHNRKLLAAEGQWVDKRQVIAYMGSSGTDRTALHFEIRKRGRPVNPLEYLPRR